MTYGWRKDALDRRDLVYAPTVEALPSLVDLRASCAPVYDQGALGSCTANAIAAALEFDQIVQKLPIFQPSRLFIYYNERAMEGTVASDAGAEIRDGIKSVAKQGAAHESIWPYNVGRFAWRPTQAAYRDAKLHPAVLYQRLASPVDYRACLAAGSPFVFGFTVFESFESDAVAATGVVPMPQPHEAVLGGHAVLAVGYDDRLQRYIVRNSWGSGWGLKGYFTIPYAYVNDPQLASDVWTVKSTK